MRNSSRTWLERENEIFARSVPPGSRVLDAGAGDQPYRRLFSHCTYEAADFEKVDKPYAKSTYVCDITNIPVEDGRFDAIVFNQVLEHLPDPEMALNELCRILKIGGSMICTVPLFYAEHETPYDFYRYTQFGIKHVMQRAGFEILRIDWMEGYLGTFAYQLQMASRFLPIRPRNIAPGLWGIVSSPMLLLMRLLSFGAAALLNRLDERHRFIGTGMPKNYVVILRRPENSEGLVSSAWLQAPSTAT